MLREIRNRPKAARSCEMYMFAFPSTSRMFFERYIATPFDAVDLRLHQTHLANVHRSIGALPPQLLSLYQAHNYTVSLNETSGNVRMYFTQLDSDLFPHEVIYVYETPEQFIVGMSRRIHVRTGTAVYIEFGAMQVYTKQTNTFHIEFINYVAADVCNAICDVFLDNHSDTESDTESDAGDITLKFRASHNVPVVDCPQDIILWNTVRRF